MNQHKPVRVGVVGVGSFGQHHARVYSHLEGVDFVGVADHDNARAKEVAQANNTQAFDSFEKLLEAGVDAVSLAIPTEHHFEAAMALLKAGVDVLVEKPLVKDLGEADTLIETAKEQKRILQAGHLERFNPAVEMLLETVRAPRFLEIHRIGGFPERSLDIDVLLDVMIHDLDIVLALIQSEVKFIHAVGVQALTQSIDIANVRLEFENGCVANLTASRISAEKVRKIRVFEPMRYLSVDYATKEMESYALEITDGKPRIVHQKPNIPQDEPLRRELESFIDSVRSRKAPRVGGPEARRALELALRIQKDIQTRNEAFSPSGK